MPTVYTAPVESGEMTKLSEFALRCARAFGSLIYMRDEPLDAPIPDRFEPNNDHNYKQIEFHKNYLALIANPDTRLQAWEEDFQQKLKTHQTMAERVESENANYEAMLDKVRNWECPMEIIGLKNFMLEQLKDSMRFGSVELNEPEKTDIKEWYGQTVEITKGMIERYEQLIDEEKERTAEKNNWLRTVRTSLEGVDD